MSFHITVLTHLVLCVSDIDDCVNVTCQNEGQCVDGVASFTCSCQRGFSGQHCELGRLMLP